MFQMRTSLPERGNKYYNTTSVGGYSLCIQGKCGSTGKPCVGLNVLANCVGYANGRFAEIIGKNKIEYQFISNAENFIEHAKSYGLKISDKPTLGGIMVWQKGNTLNSNDGAGHVAIVEKIIDGNTIYTSESGYNSTTFWNSTRRNNNGRWGMGYGYTFRGCIVNPSVKDEPKPKPEPTDITGDIVYQSYDNDKKQWLPQVVNDRDYAGNMGNSMGGFRAKPKYGKIYMQAHIRNGNWLDTVESTHYKENSMDGDSYAGLFGMQIDGIKVWSSQGYVSYRAHLLGGNWLPWVNKADNTPDGYAGILGNTIDAIQMR